MNYLKETIHPNLLQRENEVMGPGLVVVHATLCLSLPGHGPWSG